MADLVLGGDVGGTSTRVAVAALDAGVLAVATGGPGNPNVVGLEASAAEIRRAAERALAGLGGTVRAAVVGLAGGGRAAAEPGFAARARPAGVGVGVRLVSDLVTCFSSATPRERGCVLVAGTGAVAGRVVGEELTDRRDGWGWLLGDRGSGFWLGRAAVRATLAALEGSRPLGPLHRAVLARAGAGGYADLLQACYASPPTWLGGFAPLVSRWADEDPEAGALADEAARLLAATLSGLRPRPGEPIVVGGSVLTSPGPVRDRFAARVGPDLPLLEAESGVVGAVWVAARTLGHARPELHQRLVATYADAPRR